MTEAASASERKDPLTEEFLRYLAVERNASARTLKAYHQALAAFRSETKAPWKKCTADNFRDYLFALMKRGQARSYVRLQFSAFRTFYRFLAARKGLRSNPVREVQLPKLDKKLPLVLTRQQIEELLAAPARVAKNRAAPLWMPLRDVAIMELFYSSGLRLSELACSGCGRCGSLHGIGPGLRQRQKGTRLSGRIAGAGGNLALSCSGECSFGAAIHK
jgi:site-specific recombinase XerD